MSLLLSTPQINTSLQTHPTYSPQLHATPTCNDLEQAQILRYLETNTDLTNTMSAIESSIGTFFARLSQTTASFFTYTPLSNLADTAEAAEVLEDVPNRLVSAVTNHFAFLARLFHDVYLGPEPVAAPPVEPQCRIAFIEVQGLLAPIETFLEQYAWIIFMVLLAIIGGAVCLSADGHWCGKLGGEAGDGERLAKFAKEGELDKGLKEVEEPGCRKCLLGLLKRRAGHKKRKLQRAKEIWEEGWKELMRREWWVGRCEPLSEERRQLIAGITRVGRAIKGVEEDLKMIEKEDLRLEVRGVDGKCCYSFESKGSEVEVGEKQTKPLQGVKNRLWQSCEILAVPVEYTRLDPTADKERARRGVRGESVDATSDDSNVGDEAGVIEPQKCMAAAIERVETEEGKEHRMESVVEADKQFKEKLEKCNQRLREIRNSPQESEKMGQGSKDGVQSASDESDWEVLEPEDEGRMLR